MLTNILKRAGTDAFKYFPVRLVPALTSLITVPLFTRLIAREDYGNFSLISSAISLVAVIVTQWVNGSIVRFYWTYEKEGRADDYVATSIWSVTGALVTAALVCGAVVMLVGKSISPGLMHLIPIGLASLAVNYLSDSLLQILRAANKSTGYALLSVAKTLVGTAFSVWFVAGPRLGAWGILAGVVLGNLIVTPFGLWMTAKQGSLSPKHVRKDVLAQFASYGLPLVPAAMSSWALVLADRYVIGALRGAGEVGLYSTAYTLGDKIMNLIIMPLMITMGPVMVMTFEKNGQELAQQVQTQFTRYYAMVTFPIIAGMSAVTYQFFQVFVGPSYREAYAVLPIVMVGVMGYGLVQIAANGVALHKRSTIIMTNTVAAAAINVASNLYFVPKFGYIAAALNTVLAYFVLLGLTWYRSKPYMAWQLPWPNLARITFSSALMGFVVWLGFHRLTGTVWVLIAEVVAGIVLYALALVVLRELEPAERDFFRDLAGRAAAKLRLRRP
ncbi:MAG: hypothetical protein D9V44_03590 [Actinobacteria bacterium]|nr:MAG: hypothetical protein D9V44_03590 [Actinomycetota bacterium]